MLSVAGIRQCAPAPAHDVWLAPVGAPSLTSDGVRVGLWSGEHDRPEAMGLHPARIERLWLTEKAGVREVTLAQAQASVELGRRGSESRTLAYISMPASSILPAIKFDDYLREAHLHSILLQRQSVVSTNVSATDEGFADADGRVALARGDGEWIRRTTHMQAAEETGRDW